MSRREVRERTVLRRQRHAVDHDAVRGVAAIQHVIHDHGEEVGCGDRAEPLCGTSFHATPEVVGEVQDGLPGSSSEQAADKMLGGMLTAARRSEAADELMYETVMVAVRAELLHSRYSPALFKRAPCKLLSRRPEWYIIWHSRLPASQSRAFSMLSFFPYVRSQGRPRNQNSA